MVDRVARPGLHRHARRARGRVSSLSCPDGVNPSAPETTRLEFLAAAAGTWIVATNPQAIVTDSNVFRLI
jgi:hypothetical protein